MSEKKQIRLKTLVSKEAIDEIEHWRSKYPAERKRPPIIAALKVVQAENGNSLNDDLMMALADYLDVPHIAVFEVATFYTMFHLKPVGEHVISVCTNLSCMMCGSKSIVEHLEKRLKISLGETTHDGRFTLKEVECMAACAGAPMLEVSETYHENLTFEKVDSILEELGLEVAHGE
ncbi:NADH-quinone oxidoreductase subunit NuoE [Pleionea sediminis]|uniref:NADH-quinone oxidoreductase subunit NuoE family protein n=1 Tax=Pleionea sediminis TaxID=2569479 RepID=UPI001184FDE2|nr:NAD(P)H-dependent oxidoreductase subunit E [Pleionea sediminis]